VAGELKLRIAVGARGGEPPVIGVVAEDLPPDPQAAAREAVRRLDAAGGVALLAGRA
jgi:hypothetical protein